MRREIKNKFTVESLSKLQAISSGRPVYIGFTGYIRNHMIAYLLSEKQIFFRQIDFAILLLFSSHKRQISSYYQ